MLGVARAPLHFDEPSVDEEPDDAEQPERPRREKENEPLTDAHAR